MDGISLVVSAVGTQIYTPGIILTRIDFFFWLSYFLYVLTSFLSLHLFSSHSKTKASWNLFFVGTESGNVKFLQFDGGEKGN